MATGREVLLSWTFAKIRQLSFQYQWHTDTKDAQVKIGTAVLNLTVTILNLETGTGLQ
jgi:hypothetical protein